MRTSTGIVNISFKDDGDREVELMKEFVDDEEELGRGQKKHGNKRKVLSVVLSNVPLYNGERLSASRMNDNKLELLAFDAKTNYNKVGSIGGEIKFRFQTEKEVYLKVGDACYAIERPV